MLGTATNCSIRRITIGKLPLQHEALIDQLRNIAEKSGVTDTDEEPWLLLYRWLEDVDDLLYFDGPIYDDSINVHLGNLSFSIHELITLGSKLRVVDRSVVSPPSGHILAYTEMAGNGSLEWLSICGDEDALRLLCESGAIDDDPGKIGSNLEILVKKWETPIGELTMFVGLAFRSDGSYQWNEHWGDGSYENDVNSQEANLLVEENSCFKSMAKDSVDALITEVCSEFE